MANSTTVVNAVIKQKQQDGSLIEVYPISKVKNIKDEQGNDLEKLLGGKSDEGHTHDYSELTNTPTKLSNFQNDTNYITLSDIPKETRLAETEPVDEHASMWFDTNVPDDSNDVILDQNSGVYVESPSGIFYKVCVSEDGRLSTELVELDTTAKDKVRTVFLKSANNIEYILGVTDEGELTTELLELI